MSSQFLSSYISSYIYIHDFYCHETRLLKKSGMLEISKWYWSSVSPLFDLGLLRHWRGALSPLQAKRVSFYHRSAGFACPNWKNMNEPKDNYLYVHKMHILDLNRTSLLSCTKLSMLRNLQCLTTSSKTWCNCGPKELIMVLINFHAYKWPFF